MPSHRAPDCSVNLSPELLALLADAADGRHPEDRAGGSRSDPSEAQLTGHELATPRTVHLRRDGARPLSFVGALIAEHTDCVTLRWAGGRSDASRTCRVYADRDGACLAHLAIVPESDGPMRPVYRAAEVASRDALIRLLQTNQPGLCFAAAPNCDGAELSADTLAAPTWLRPQHYEYHA